MDKKTHFVVDTAGEPRYFVRAVGCVRGQASGRDYGKQTMKKTSVLVAVAAVAMTGAVALAQTNVYSRNAVGAVRVDIPPAGQFVMAGFSFKPIGADAITLKDLLGTNQLVKFNAAPFASRVYVWDPSAGGGGGYISVFQKPDGDFYKIASPTEKTNPVITAGQGFWIQSPNNSTTSMSVFIMGEVLSSNQTARIHTAGFMMIANPYSAPLDLNDANIDWVADGAKVGANAVLADSAYVWDGSGYISVYLRSSDSNWHYATPPYALATNAVIPVGGAAWYKAKQQFTNSLVRPYPWW